MVAIKGQASSDLVHGMYEMAQGVSKRLREERQKLGLNQTDFAAIGGVTRNTQSVFERKLTILDLAYLDRLQSAGVDVGYVLTGVSSRAELQQLIAAYMKAPPRARAAATAALSACGVSSE
ncbi:helix-turn-helix domain-containing protein [Jeongeupia chitinilytica]|uniref:HTH cro/C1-type domain-containing protein n=1 Tax=Jeongeupia chitinilytica TaxID=1041641 RepID=A0ABQ3GXT4_9NEIS|nr:helix-turn-helix transcriptional regulator [Jeongeupia chitinilytica]GHD59814.1 hypothetical protein GCM10007350_11630 [Jeongeupia chitinilytica]